MRTFLILLCFAFLAPVLGACAAEEDYPVVIGDTTDGDDDVVIPADEVPLSGGTVHKATRAQAIQHCNEIQYMHYNDRSACYQTYQNPSWLQGALTHCTNYVNNVVTNACLDKYNASVYWQTRRSFINVPPPGYWYGDKYRWWCLGGWPVKSSPNDTDALHQQWLDCEPGV